MKYYTCRALRAPLLLISATFIAVLCIGAAAHAATTIGTDIQTDGMLSVTGTTTLMGNVQIGTTTASTDNLLIVATGTPILELKSGTLGSGNADAEIVLTGAGLPQWSLGAFGYSSYAGFSIGDNEGFTPFEAESTETNGDPYRVFFNRYNPNATTTGVVFFEFSDTETLQEKNALASFEIGSESGAAGKVGIKIFAAPGQTGDLQDWDNNSGSSILSEITANGALGIGASMPTGSLDVATSSTNATTTVVVGKSGQNKGSCLVMYDDTGAVQYVSIQSGALVVSSTSCE